MRIAFVSDIHGNLAALEAVVADITARGVDRVVNLGDSLSGPLLPEETAQYLMRQNWMHLAGNHERQLLTLPPERQSPSDAYARSVLSTISLAWAEQLRDTCQYAEDIFLCHGSPRSDCEYFLDTVDPAGLRVATQAEIEQRRGKISAPLIACGHTHIPRSIADASGQLIINPGSVGLPAYDDEHPHFHRVENGSPDARYAIAERQADTWVSELIAVPYDYEPMAQLAESRKRPDWACALRTGKVS